MFNTHDNYISQLFTMITAKYPHSKLHTELRYETLRKNIERLYTTNSAKTNTPLTNHCTRMTMNDFLHNMRYTLSKNDNDVRLLFALDKTAAGRITEGLSVGYENIGLFTASDFEQNYGFDNPDDVKCLKLCWSRFKTST